MIGFSVLRSKSGLHAQLQKKKGPVKSEWSWLASPVTALHMMTGLSIPGSRSGLYADAEEFCCQTHPWNAVTDKYCE